MVFFGWSSSASSAFIQAGGGRVMGYPDPFSTPLAGLSSFFSGLLPRNSPFCARVPPSLVVGSARVGGGGFVLFWVPFVAKTSPFRLFRAFSPFSPLLYFGVEIKKIKEDQSKQKIG